MKKTVSFHATERVIMELLPSSWPYRSVEKEDLWHTGTDLEISRKLVGTSRSAVNDTCGDLDVVDHALICRTAILREQRTRALGSSSSDDEQQHQEQLAKTSRELSEPSVEMARLYALVLENDVDEKTPLTYEVLRNLVNRVLVHGEETPPNNADENDEDENSFGSIGTIDELPEDKWDGGAIDSRVFSLVDHIIDDRQSRCACDEEEEDWTPIKTTRTPSPRIFTTRGPSYSIQFLPENSADKEELPSASFSGHVGSRRNLKSMSKDIGEINLKRQFFDDLLGKHHTPHSCSESQKERGALSEFESITKKRRIEKQTEETEDRCNVAHALISIARWEFRSFQVTTH